MYRFLRCFLCLLVVCCLILNLSPIKADATAATVAIAGASTVAVPAVIVVGAALIALGIMAGTNDDFQRVVSNSVDSFGDWVKDGTVELIQTVDELGKKAYYVAGDMLEDVRSFCISQEVITPNELVLDSVRYPPADALAEAAAAPYSLLVYHEKVSSGYLSFDLAYSYEGPVTAKSTQSDGTGIWIGCEDGISGYIWSSSGVFSPFTGVAVTSNSSKRIISAQEFGEKAAKFTSSYDLTLGQVSSVPVDGSSARQWSEEYTNRGLYVVEGSGGSSTPPEGDSGDEGDDNNGKWYWPLVLGAASFGAGAGIGALTQQDQWTGDTPEDFDAYTVKQDYKIVTIPDIEIGFGIGIELDPVEDPDPGDDDDPIIVPGPGIDPAPDTGGDTGEDPDSVNWFAKIVGFLENIWNSILELPSKFATWFDNIISEIQELPSKFADWFGNLASKLENIWEAICNIPEAIGNVLRSIFVPSEDFLTEKVQDLRNRFNWIEPILGYGDFIKAQLVNPEPPVLYVHLGNAEGSYNYGGTVKFLDLTWYERYKSQGDAIISGFLWALFAWRMYVKLPGIINGVAGDVGHISYGESAWQKAEGRKDRKEKGGKNK